MSITKCAAMIRNGKLRLEEVRFGFKENAQPGTVIVPSDSSKYLAAMNALALAQMAQEQSVHA